MTDFLSLRMAMVARDIERRGISEPRLLAALREVPREQFVAPALAAQAYDDRPLPIGAGQTISQPYIVALMIEAARVGPDSRVLEVGAGSGYAAAVIGQIAAEVVAIERHAELAQAARGAIERLDYANVEIIAGDGTAGWPAKAPYDAILVAAAGKRVPPALLAQLKVGGRLVIPIGGMFAIQQLIRVTRSGEDRFDETNLGAVRFVPLIGGEPS